MPELFEFQKVGAQWLAGRNHALLADEMGLGKSAQAIAAADDRLLARILVLCPAIARINWSREFEKFSEYGRPFQIIQRGDQLIHPRISVICSYDLAVRFFERGDWKHQRFDLLILDEQHFLKSPGARRTKTVMGNKGLVHQATAVWALSGTPMPNHPGELWVLLYTFGVTKLKHRAFLERYCSFAPGAGPRDPMMQITGVNTKHLSELRHLLKKISLRRLKKDVLDLPPILYGDMTVQPGPVSIKELFPGRDPEDVRRELRYQEDDVVDFFELEAMAGSCSTLRRYTGAQKMAPAAELVEEELDAGLYSKIVLFCVHQVVVEGLMTRLSRFNPVCVYGKTPAGKRQENIDRFQTDPTCAIFIANIKAAGTAITLTAADQVLFVEQEWVPGDNAQAAMRVHRIGQDRPVTARFLALWGSIDEKISAVLRRKTSEITAVLDSP